MSQAALTAARGLTSPLYRLPSTSTCPERCSRPPPCSACGSRRPTTRTTPTAAPRTRRRARRSSCGTRASGATSALTTGVTWRATGSRGRASTLRFWRCCPWWVASLGCWAPPCTTATSRSSAIAASLRTRRHAPQSPLHTHRGGSPLWSGERASASQYHRRHRAAHRLPRLESQRMESLAVDRAALPFRGQRRWWQCG